jgi:hypothetical protein
MIGNYWYSYTIRWIEDGNLFHRSNLTENESKKEFELLKMRKPLKAELIEVKHIEDIKDTYKNECEISNQKCALENIIRNNPAAKQLSLLL